MSRLPLPDRDGGQRYPGLDVMALAPHWDPATTAAVAGRVGVPTAVRFFTTAEVATAAALFDQLLHQREDPRVPVVSLVDARLAEQQTDGWHLESMPEDGEAWRRSLAALDDEARAAHGRRFHELEWKQQTALLRQVQHEDGQWHGLSADAIWSLWTRYACTAFYAHPWAWEEIGFSGPAYPRGYKHLGVDAREPFEVADTRPDEDPVPDGEGGPS